MRAIKYNKGQEHASLSTLLTVYDLDYIPGTYDMVAAILNLEVIRRALEYDEVRIFIKGDRPWKIPSHRGQDVLDSVIRPFMKMAKISETDDTPTARQGIFNPSYNPSLLVWAYEKLGWKPKPFYPNLDESAQAFQYAGCITITLREMDFLSARNSRKDEWLKTAKWLQDEGHRVIFVRDTAYANEEIDGFEISSWAARDLNHRLELYRAARLNLFVSNGPAALCIYGDTSYLNFMTGASVRQFEDQHTVFTCTDVKGLMPANFNALDQWEAWFGFKKGGQFPWSRPNQRLIWDEDVTENIIGSIEENLDD